MKSRDIFLPSLSGILIAGLIVFQSCAHQNRSSEDVDSMDEATYSENGTDSSMESSDQANNSDELSSGPEASSKSEENGLAGPLSDNSESNSSLGSEDSLEKDLESEGLEDKNGKAAMTSPDTVPKSATDSLENELEGDSLAANDGLESSGNLEESAAGTAGAAALGSSDLESELESVEPVQPKTEELAEQKSITPEVEPLSKNTLKLEKKIKRSNRKSSISVPKIPAKAIKKAGTSLNRFYFVRLGDNPKTVSSLIYGTPNKAKLLTKWNGKSWAPGKLVYYASAENPKDSRMDSFYKENGIQPEEYQVAQGDWLSKIAKVKLGSPNSWTEIAVVNGITSPKSLEVGQRIAIYPKDLTVKPQETMIAKNEVVTPPPVVEQKPVEPPPVVTPPPVQAKTPPPIVGTPKPVTMTPQKSFDSNSFIEQNMFSGGMILAAILLLALLVVKKRQKAKIASQRADFGDGDEGFEPPTKLKRK